MKFFLLCFKVQPPPENIYPQEYGKPLRMSHSVVQDPCLSAEMLAQIEQAILYYNNQQDRVPFTSRSGHYIILSILYVFDLVPNHAMKHIV